MRAWKVAIGVSGLLALHFIFHGSGIFCFRNFGEMVSGKNFDVGRFSLDWLCVFVVFFLGACMGVEGSGLKNDRILNVISSDISPTGLVSDRGKIESNIGGKSNETLKYTFSKRETNYFLTASIQPQGPQFRDPGSYSISLKTMLENSSVSSDFSGPPRGKKEIEKPDQLSNDKLPEPESSGDGAGQQSETSWFSLDLGEIADWEAQGSYQANVLEKRAADLLNEQDRAIYGLNQENPVGKTQISSDEEDHASNSYMKVIYRKK